MNAGLKAWYEEKYLYSCKEWFEKKFLIINGFAGLFVLTIFEYKI